MEQLQPFYLREMKQNQSDPNYPTDLIYPTSPYLQIKTLNTM